MTRPDALRILVLAAVIGLVAQGLLLDNLLGVTAPILAVALLAIAAIVVVGAINVVGPSRLIAEQNVARVIDPSLVPPDGKSGLDVIYATRLGDDAIPALVTVLPALDPADRSELLRRLADRRDALRDREAMGWPSWNFGREAAKAALADLPSR